MASVFDHNDKPFPVVIPRDMSRDQTLQFNAHYLLELAGWVESRRNVSHSILHSSRLAGMWTGHAQ